MIARLALAAVTALARGSGPGQVLQAWRHHRCLRRCHACLRASDTAREAGDRSGAERALVRALDALRQAERYAPQGGAA